MHANTLDLKSISRILAASIIDIDFISCVLACMGGVLLAGIIMGVASTGVLGALGAIF